MYGIPFSNTLRYLPATLPLGIVFHDHIEVIRYASHRSTMRCSGTKQGCLAVAVPSHAYITMGHTPFAYRRQNYE